MQSDDTQCGGLFDKKTQKRPAPTSPNKKTRRESGDDSLFDKVAGGILGKGSPAAKDLTRSLLEGSQESKGGGVGKARKNVVSKISAAAEKNEAAAKMKLKAATKKKAAAKMDLEVSAMLKAAAEEFEEIIATQASGSESSEDE
ncbi:hypothetical protein THARTR1_03942 [Trichoderma harzianum]|uniref:Uncharacterized protein n=1 Tax=Trichoderma harzianum TaxID=5544 RepID=A0A2K0UDZ3_TRIHA|nr:hypothetical protein THARTR1_03942 [Trichoderma harzianum]